MAHLLSIPENVMIQYVFPNLDHNDLLRLRQTSKQTKALADAYLWTPQPGHQGKWILKIDSSKDHKLKAFLKMNLPPPSRLHIANEAEKAPREQRSLFEDDHLEEFMNLYGQFVTTLKIDKLFFPFTSAKELGFYDSLVNMKKLHCKEMITVGGAAQFEEKTKTAEGSYLIRPTFKKLKIFKLDETDCIGAMWNLINGVSNNLEELLHPFRRSGVANQPTNFAPIRELIDRRRRGGMESQTTSKLLYDWKYVSQFLDPLERLRVFARCHENGVMIKNLDGLHLDCLLWNENGSIDKNEAIDPVTGEWIWNSQINYQRNQLIGNLIHSLSGVTDYAFLVELPALEKFKMNWYHSYSQTRRRHGVGYPQWPNLKKMVVQLDRCSDADLRFLLGEVERPNLEELSLVFRIYWDMDALKVRLPRNLGNCCGNVKKLSVNCPWADPFFVGLWNGLPLLEDVTLRACPKLTNKGFMGINRSRPVFLKLKKLRHLSIENLEESPRITDAVFQDVFRHLKLTSFKLSSHRTIKGMRFYENKNISLAGIRELLTGTFAETIEKLYLDKLNLKNVSDEELKEVLSCFRSSKMI